MHQGQAKCGAKTRSGTTPGAPCKDIAMANGRCKRHGGKSTGAKNPLSGPLSGVYTHGIYTKFFRDDEKTLIDEGALRVGQVETELNVVRIRLKRALEAKEAWAKAREEGKDDAELVLIEKVDGEAPAGEDGTVSIYKETKRLPDFEGIIDRCLARIESLEKTRKELLKTDDDGDGDGGEPGSARLTITGGLPARKP